LVGGLPGTGKSTLAAGLGDALGATILRSDEVRKQLAGLDPHRRADAPYGTGLYRAGVTEATYAALLDRAAAALAGGESVILDASWLAGRRRRRARQLASTHHAALSELRCDAPPALAGRRLTDRRLAGGDPSDATPAIAAAMRGDADPWPEATVIDTAQDRSASLVAARVAVARAAAGAVSS
ncbi:MAG TPA: AAA family ATPase, partial [Acidimicrobiales bacterium]|nr:AAA family ATPase [Acidimicrobiales bacterium]